MSQQFCIKKTPEEFKKEMDSSTQKEIEKLAEHLKANPTLLRNKYKSDSDTDSSSSSSSSSDTDSDSSSSKSNYKHKINKNAIDIYKKETVIDKLEEKNYFKTLELNNLMLENSQLKKENLLFITKIKEYELQTKIISEIIDMNKNEPLKNNGSYLIDTNFSTTNMNSKMMLLQKEFDAYNTKILNLIDDLNKIPNSNIKTHYNQELAKISILLNKNYAFNNKLIDNFLTKVKNREKCSLVVMILTCTILLMFMKDFAFNNFLELLLQSRY